MELDKRIEKISNYFVEMKVVSDVNNVKNMYISCTFPQRWIIDNIVDEKFNGAQTMEQNGMTYFWIEIEKNTENLFNAIDCVIQRNLENEAKMKLLEDKTNELRNIFFDENNSLEKLQSLRISFDTTPPLMQTPNVENFETEPIKGKKSKKEC